MPIPRPEFATLLLRANRSIEQLMIERLRQAGVAQLRMGHLTLLRVLPHENPARLSDLAAAAGVSRQAITQVATDLAGMGIVVISVDPADRRGRLVAYTGLGRRGHLKALEAFQSIEDDLLEAIGRRRLDASKGVLADAADCADQWVRTGEEAVDDA